MRQVVNTYRNRYCYNEFCKKMIFKGEKMWLWDGIACHVDCNAVGDRPRKPPRPHQPKNKNSPIIYSGGLPTLGKR